MNLSFLVSTSGWCRVGSVRWRGATSSFLSRFDPPHDVRWMPAEVNHRRFPHSPRPWPLWMAAAVGEYAKRSRASTTTNNKEAASSNGTYSGFTNGAYDGPPLAYDPDALQAYWSRRGLELGARWADFVRIMGPFVARLVQELTRGNLDEPTLRSLARQGRECCERLGPTYVKLAQVMSVRPDILPLAVTDELALLQDAVKPFDTAVAVDMIKQSLGRPLREVFSEFTDEPVASASLAQVYRARLAETGEEVAVKIQRPDALTVVSKDLYVLQRAMNLFQGIMQRFTKQRTDYVELLNTFAAGFYNEMDFLQEADNQQRLRQTLLASMDGAVYVPYVYREMSSRILLVTEWVDGIKLTESPPEVLQQLLPLGQECFLRQLLEEPGLFHCDPHPGNMLYLRSIPPRARDLREQPQLCLVDFGLVISIPKRDREVIVTGIVHLANRDWDAVTDDFIQLGMLPAGEIDRAQVTRLLERVLEPYVFVGGGLAGYTGEGGMFSPSFQNLARDLARASAQIPFSLPPYVSLLARAISTLEGIALRADPQYKIVLQSYPYVARRLLRSTGGQASFRAALHEILYPGGGAPGEKAHPLNMRRLLTFLNSALGKTSTASAAFVDLEAMPEGEQSASVSEVLDLVLAPDSEALREVVVQEASVVLDLALRQVTRRAVLVLGEAPPSPLELLRRLLPRSLQPPLFLPLPPLPPLPPLIPPVLRERVLQPLVDRLAPRLSQSESIYLRDALTVLSDWLGVDLAPVAAGQWSAVLRAWTTSRDTNARRKLQQMWQEVSGSSPRARQRSRALRQLVAEVSNRLRDIEVARMSGSSPHSPR